PEPNALQEAPKGQRCLPRAGIPLDEVNAIRRDPAAKHFVESRGAGRDARLGSLVIRLGHGSLLPRNDSEADRRHVGSRSQPNTTQKPLNSCRTSGVDASMILGNATFTSQSVSLVGPVLRPMSRTARIRDLPINRSLNKTRAIIVHGLLARHEVAALSRLNRRIGSHTVVGKSALVIGREPPNRASLQR